MRTHLVRHEPGKHRERDQREDDVEDVVGDNGVELIEQDVASFAENRQQHQESRQDNAGAPA